MLDDETLVAATDIIRNLARNGQPASVDKLRLPGPDSPAKQAYETELVALQAHITHLTKTAATRTDMFPMTPNEPGAYPFDSRGNSNSNSSSSNSNSNGTSSAPAVPTPSTTSTTTSNKYRPSPLSLPSQVSEFLTARADDAAAGRQVSGEELGHVRDYVARQADEIQAHRAAIADASQRLERQQDRTERALGQVEAEEFAQLRRELLKHQQANVAFQKALKEIGSIITNVANGDLTHKVLIHKVEMDPEITKFKRTSMAAGLRLRG